MGLSVRDRRCCRTAWRRDELNGDCCSKYWFAPSRKRQAQGELDDLLALEPQDVATSIEVNMVRLLIASEFYIFTCGPATEIGVMIGAPVGFVTGGFLGANITSDRWVTVPIGRVEMDVDVRGGKIGVRVPVGI